MAQNNMRKMFTEQQIIDLIKQNKIDITDLVDKDRHPRFIEGDITTKEISGISYNYAKWSLSGTHLLIVIAGKIDNGSTISFQTMAEFNIPEWIINKLYPTYSNVIDRRNNLLLFNEDGSNSQSINYLLTKDTPKLVIYMGSITTTDDRYFRLQFDLLVDNE